MSWNFVKTNLPGVEAYVDVTSNSSGTQLLAIASDTVYASSDSGTTWEITPLPHGSISNFSVDSDSTGQYLIMSTGGDINVSTTQGSVNWVSSRRFGSKNAVTAVAVGQLINGGGVYMYAVVGKVDEITKRPTRNDIYVSNNSGSSWELKYSIPRSNGGFSSISASKNGPYVYVVSDTGNFYISTDNGSSWTKSSSLNVPGQISISNNGQYSVFAVDNDEPDSSERTQTLTSVSQNTAYSYTPIHLTYGQTPPISAINGSGQYMFTAASQSSTSTTSTIYYSSDGNTTGGTPTFTSTGSPDLEWTSVASNSDGNQIICSSANGGVYIGTFTPSS